MEPKTPLRFLDLATEALASHILPIGTLHEHTLIEDAKRVTTFDPYVEHGRDIPTAPEFKDETINWLRASAEKLLPPGVPYQIRYVPYKLELMQSNFGRGVHEQKPSAACYYHPRMWERRTYEDAIAQMKSGELNPLSGCYIWWAGTSHDTPLAQELAPVHFLKDSELLSRSKMGL